MNDMLELLAGILVFIALVWPFVGFIWIMRWIRRKEHHALSHIAPQEEIAS